MRLWTTGVRLWFVPMTRYNVSCSQHFRTSRGRPGPAAPPPQPPAPLETSTRRRGPPWRTSAEIACAKISGKHLPVKVNSVYRLL